MSDYQVNPTDVVRVMNELTADNEKLACRIEQLKQLQADLAGIWEGEADRAFNATIMKDITTLESYHGLMQQFCLALQEIGQAYAQTELDNARKIES